MKNVNSVKKGTFAGGHKPLEGAQVQAVANLFAVLSEESRLRILQLLQQGPASVNTIAERTGLKQANASKQLGILLSQGIIARRQEGNLAIYSIAMPLVFDLCNLVCSSLADQAMQRAAELAPAVGRR